MSVVPRIPLGGLPAAAPSAVPGPAPRAMTEAAFLGDLTDGRVADFLRGGVASASGEVVTPETALRTGTVFRCVSLITGAIATLPIDLKRRLEGNRRVDAADHALWTLLRRKPNPWQTPAVFKRYLQACVLLRGRGMAQIVRGVGRKPIALIPLNPDRVQVRQDPSNFRLIFRYTRPDGTTIELPHADVFYLLGLTLDGVNGVSALTYARETIGEALATARHSATLFRNGTTIGGVLTHPNKLGQEGQDILRASLEAYRGADNAHKNLILEEGMKYERLGLTLADAQFIQSREFSQIEIAQFFGVPPHMAGLTTKVTSFGAGIEQQSQGFVTYTLQDWLTMWTEAIGAVIEEPDVYAAFNLNALVRGDIKTRSAAYAVGRQWGWLSANDVRAKEDEDPIEGGDTYLSPINMAAAGTDATTLLDTDPNQTAEGEDGPQT